MVRSGDGSHWFILWTSNAVITTGADPEGGKVRTYTEITEEFFNNDSILLKWWRFITNGTCQWSAHITHPGVSYPCDGVQFCFIITPMKCIRWYVPSLDSPSALNSRIWTAGKRITSLCTVWIIHCIRQRRIWMNVISSGRWWVC